MHEKNPGIMIGISDNGQKMSEMEINSLFDIFSLNRQSLRFAKIISEAHFGKINITQQGHQGIELQLELFTSEHYE